MVSWWLSIATRKRLSSSLVVPMRRARSRAWAVVFSSDHVSMVSSRPIARPPASTSSGRSPVVWMSCAASHATKVSAAEASAVTSTIRVRVAWFTASTAPLPGRGALHLAPRAAGAGGPLPETLQSPERHELAIAEVLEDGSRGEDEHIARPAVEVEADLLEQQRAHREHGSEGNRHQQEDPERARADDPGEEPDRHEQVADDLDQRAQPLEGDHVREREPSRGAAVGVPEQGAVIRQALAQAALPAGPLAAQHSKRLGRVGPADRVGQEGDVIRTPGEAMQPVQAHHELHVLPDGVVAVATRGDHHVLAEHAEGAGN